MNPHRMTMSFAAATILAVLASVAPAQPAAEAPRGRGPQGPRVVSPEVAADRQVTFRILAPKAEAVRLTGSDIPGNGQGAEMKKDPNGVWEVTLGPIESRGVSVQLQRGRRVGDRSPQPVDQRIQHQCLEPRVRSRVGFHGHEGRAPRRGGDGHVLLEVAQAVPPDARLHAAGL